MSRGGYRPGSGRPAKANPLRNEPQLYLRLSAEQWAYVEQHAEEVGIARQEVIRRLIDAARGSR